MPDARWCNTEAETPVPEVLPRDGNIDFGCVTLYFAVSRRFKDAVPSNTLQANASLIQCFVFHEFAVVRKTRWKMQYATPLGDTKYAGQRATGFEREMLNMVLSKCLLGAY